MSISTESPIDYPFPAAPSLFQPPVEYSKLRQISPVFRILFQDTGKEGWLATGYHEVRAVLTQPVFSRAAAKSPSAPRTGPGRLAAESLIGLDPPEHTRLRRVVMGAFGRSQAEQLRPHVRKIANELTTRILATSRPVDLVDKFAFPLSIRVICDVLGIPADDRDFFCATSDVLLCGWSYSPAEVEKAFVELRAYFRGLIPAKRSDPRDDLLSAMAGAYDVGALSEDEFTSLAIFILVSGHETSASLLSLFIVTLLAHPHELRRLRADMNLLPSAVEELLRFVPISDGAGALLRVALEDTVLGGQLIKAGDAIIPAIPAANRDPAVFPEPDRLDLARRAEVTHLSFGAGFHRCVGAALARVELQESLRVLLTRIPESMHIPVDPSRLECKTFVSLRSLCALPLSW